jgi:hypothetical protein
MFRHRLDERFCRLARIAAEQQPRIRLTSCQLERYACSIQHAAPIPERKDRLAVTVLVLHELERWTARREHVRRFAVR